MKSHRRIGTCLVVALLVGGLVFFKAGCSSNNDFLGLEDYQRDLLFGGLALALLQQADGGNGGEEPPGQPIPGPEGPEGAQGLPGAEGPEGPEGPIGPAGEQGSAGPEGPAGLQGEPGSMGLSCWDIDGDGIGDPEEDVNDDGDFDALDCQGEQGPAGGGSQGPKGDPGDPGDPGEPGPEFFDQFIDDFFTYDGHLHPDLPIYNDNLVSIDEPALGSSEGTEGDAGAIGFRFAIPQIYDESNDVTMRLFFYRTCERLPEECLVFWIYALRLRAGHGIMPYGDILPDPDNRLWIRPDADWKTTPQRRVAEALLGDNGDEGLFLVVDLPINSSEGLNDTEALAVGDMLAFEIRTASKPDLSPWEDGCRYQLLGVEFFESGPGTAQLAGATLFTSSDDVNCGEITD